ncbi:hypothetical protein MNEG_4828 [Monoraphidium neglectum]|uniref:Aspartate/glutamate/uridylate kinase domain-containing protein n=1 Tax=Monoraphidium neglectum TaxID=145388 RepID=A0A0D2L8J9_9CHLO|nr:hypothetical protein MNEG_4828 [Monoraphidium neglectum]KIZ03134.1 hypothetical protein MNEG_4828 [Monoraphidium neglectum]|eukprot:XP_013902153.1 hypothetical protein MNEG_4828 [Monoraphidium neglectum]
MSATHSPQQLGEQHPRPACRCVIKLGGAAITDKSRLETLRPDTLASVAATVAALHRNGGGAVVVHGAGSFGHMTAKQFSVARGGAPGAPREQTLLGFALTRASVTKLNSTVCAALAAAGAPAAGASPCGGGWATHGGRLGGDGCAAGLGVVAGLLQAGLVPVLHGDAVLDSELGCTILSGDTIVRAVAEAFLAPRGTGCSSSGGGGWPEQRGAGATERIAGNEQGLVLADGGAGSAAHEAGPVEPAAGGHVVFLTNVAGIYDRPPEQPGAALLPEILVSPDGSWRAAADPGDDADVSGSSAAGRRRPQFACAAHDVTGGVETKVLEAAAIAALGVDVIIAEAGSAAGEAACLLGPAAFSRYAGGGQGPRFAGTLVRLEGS